jgi:Zn-dependent peptidase ImmA (M78 family)/transcriptional regulator with XRE-family HTH domain
MLKDEFSDIVISKLLGSYDDNPKRSLKELFELKVKELGINQTQALEVMQIESRALNSILNGSSSRIDMMSIIKLSKFLEIPEVDAVNLFLDILYRPDSEDIGTLEKRNYILKNFNITELKHEKIIDTVADFDHIETRILEVFNYNSIFDYRRDAVIPAYSSSKLHKTNKMCDFWIEYARQVFKKIHNTNPYNRTALIEYFPKIRWHTMSVEKGLWDVIRELYKMGITVIYLPKFKKLHIRGATFNVNNRPCIVLTDYKGFYPTLWFSLLHELHHVLFDWEEILVSSFHLSGSSDSTDLYTKIEIEEVADKFARDYLFSDVKMEELKPHLNNREYVKEFAKRNHVHESIPYIFSAYDNGNWSAIPRLMPNIENCLFRVKEISFRMSASEVADYNNYKIYSYERN